MFPARYGLDVYMQFMLIFVYKELIKEEFQSADRNSTGRLADHAHLCSQVSVSVPH